MATINFSTAENLNLADLPCGVLLPFTGFYQSYHFDEIDAIVGNAIDNIELVSEIDEETRNRLIELDTGHINPTVWEKIAAEIAKDYSEWFLFNLANSAKSNGINLEPKPAFMGELITPKEYNFVNDEIILHLPNGSIPNIATLEQHYPGITDEIVSLAKERLTSCSGFNSFFNPDILEVQEIDSDSYVNDVYAGIALECFALRAMAYSTIEDLECAYFEEKNGNNFYNELYFKHGKNSAEIQAIIDRHYDNA